MTQARKLTTPLDDAAIAALHAGDRVSLSGVIYTARDAAHQRIIECLKRGEQPPIPIEGQVIYYVGPSPTPPGRPIGSAGPTTSYRMDPYTPQLLKLGLKATIGKGPRSAEVAEAMRRCRAVYLAAVGGAAALIASTVRECEILAYPDLGPEAVRRLVVEDFPAIVANDIYGGDVYRM